MVGVRAALCAGLLCLISPWLARGAEIFSIRSLPELVWWGSAKDSPLFQNPDATGAVKSGDPVGYLSDLSGQNHHAVMGANVVSGGDAFRPTFNANVFRGERGVLFDGMNDFLDLNNALFRDATSFTLAIAIAGTKTNLRDQRLFGAAGPNDGVVIGVSNTERSGVSARTASASSGVENLKGHTLNVSSDPENTQIVIARYQAGGSFDLWNNGQLVASTQAPAGALLSQVDKLLGAQNTAAPGATTPVASGFGKFYFLEGMASRAALSDAQVQGLYDYWTAKLPGIQHQLDSPNLYWDAAANSDRKLTVSRDVGHIQGVAMGDGMRFTFYTNMIEKYDGAWNAVTHNENIRTGISTAQFPAVHSGDGDYYQGKVYAPLEIDFGGNGQFIAVYDANQPNLPLVAFKDISAQRHEASSLTIVPEHGQQGVMYVSSFFQDFGGGKLWMYDLADGNIGSANFGNFLGALDLPSDVHDVQGVAWHAPYFYFSMAGTSTISRLRYDNGLLDPRAERVFAATDTVQGLAFEGDTLWLAGQAGATTERVSPWVNAGATATVPEPSGAALGAVGLGTLAISAALRRLRRRQR